MVSIAYVTKLTYTSTNDQWSVRQKLNRVSSV